MHIFKCSFLAVHHMTSYDHIATEKLLETCSNLCSSMRSRQMLIWWCCTQTIIMSPPQDCIGFGHHPPPPSQWPPCLQGAGGEDQDWRGICRWTAAGHLMEFALSWLGWGRGAELMTTECVKIWLINPQAIQPLYPSLLHLHWKEWLSNTSYPNTGLSVSWSIT